MPDVSAEPAIVRPLGGFERICHLWTQRNPLHFCVVAELDGPVSPGECRSALDQLQRSHPLLSVTVADIGASGPTFVSSSAPLPLRTVEEPTRWEDVVADELTRRFDPGVAPLARAVLIPERASSVLVMSFEHSIADGVAAVNALADMISVLNGTPLARHAVPAAQEDLIAGLDDAPGSESAPTPTAPAAPVDERMTAVGSRRPFDGESPSVAGAALDVRTTESLRARCRAERTTVHAAICAAVTQVALTEPGYDFVRIFSPLSLRHLIPSTDVVAARTGLARTGFPAAAAADLWDLARATWAALTPARSPEAVAAVAGAGETTVPPDAPAEVAEAFMLGGAGFEVEVTNVGVVEMGDVTTGPLHATAVWGPAILNQITGEIVLGVITSGGQLRMTAPT